MKNVWILLSMANAIVGEYCSLCSNPFDVPRNEDGVLTYIGSTGSIQVATCIEAYGKALMGEFQDCNDLHFMSREYCDCGPSNGGGTVHPTPSPKCTLCEDGSELIDPDFVVAGLTCKEWEEKANEENDESCYAYQSSIGLHCGCNEPDWNQDEFKQYCRFCPNSGTRVKNEAIAVTDQGFQYCTKLELDINLYPIHSCAREQYLYGDICECEEISPPPTCTLCPDGSPLPKPYQRVAGQSCQKWEDLANSRPARECPSYQASFGYFCGCDKPDFTQEEFKSYCKLCPYKRLKPNKYLQTETGPLSCLVLQQMINVDNQDRCAFEKELYGSICCRNAN